MQVTDQITLANEKQRDRYVEFRFRLERERERERKSKKDKKSNNKLILLPFSSPFWRGEGSKINDFDSGNRTLHFNHAWCNYSERFEDDYLPVKHIFECNYNFSGISNVAYALAFDAIMRDYRGTHSILRENVFGWTSCKTRWNFTGCSDRA